MLPGRLVVLESGQETDSIYLSDQSGRSDIEIGRESPDARGGVRIKDPSNTLSRHQARIIYTPAAQEFRLLNLADESSNPTIVNGRELNKDESVVLHDGDILTMGNVGLKFRQKLAGAARATGSG
jgi:pSer/pThr/pTyr-binding forkhead associated (FHA) protein